MQFYKGRIPRQQPDVKAGRAEPAQPRVNETAAEKVDVLIAGTGPAGCAWRRSWPSFPSIDTMIVERIPGQHHQRQGRRHPTRARWMFYTSASPTRSSARPTG